MGPRTRLKIAAIRSADNVHVLAARAKCMVKVLAFDKLRDVMDEKLEVG